MWYQKVHYRRGFNLLPLIVLGLFFLMGGWKLFFLLPLFLVPLALFWFFSPMARRWQQEYRHGQWGNWQHGSGFDGEKRKNSWYADDDTETSGRTYDAKRKNDDDVYYV